MKKIIIFGLIFFSFLTIKVHALEDGGTYNGEIIQERIDWSYKDGVLSFSTNNDKNTYTIPKDSRNTWEKYKNDIKTIKIGKGIDVIRNNAFENYPNLEEIIFPESMGGYIGDYAFYNCPKLTHIDLPIGFSKIGDYAFNGTGIEEVELPIFVSWIEEHTFNENTTITRPAEYDEIIAAGTAGKKKMFSGTFDEGRPQYDTCYNKFYYAQFYDDTAYWKLTKEGELIVWGTEVEYGYSASRVPWGCYKDEIKYIYFNDDKTGKIKIDENYCPAGLRYKVAVYASKSVEEIMNNRIKELHYAMMADCRNDCIYGFRNLETVTINRGVELVDDIFTNNNANPEDVYISKYVKILNASTFFSSDLVNNNNKSNKLHIEVSYEDYKDNNYNYNALYREDNKEIFKPDGSFIDIISTNYYRYAGSFVSDVDDTYVSINDTSAPDTIDVDGKTYYKYETYVTNEDGVTNISIPNDATVEYVVKEIEAPNGCMVKGVTYKIDMLPKTINLVIENPKPEEPEIEESTQENPITKDSILVVLLLSVISMILIIYCTKKEKELS